MPKSSRPLPPLTLLAYGLVGVGLAAVATGLAWKFIVPDAAFWTDEDQQAYTAAHHAAHAASIPGDHAHEQTRDGSNSPHDAGAIDPQQAKRDYQVMRDRLRHAQTARNRYGQYLAMAGVLLAIVGMTLLRRLSPAAAGRRG